MNTYEIYSASTTTELNDIVEAASFEVNCELDNSMTYAEQAEFLLEEAPKSGNGRKGMEQLASLLNEAEIKWHQLEV